MNTKTTSALALSSVLLCAAPTVQAGGLDFSGQPINLIFANGNEARLKLGYVSPSISGTFSAPGFGGTGKITNAFGAMAFGIKTDITDKWSISVEVDRPYFGKVSYDEWAAGKFAASFDSKSITVLGRYKINDRFSVYGGPRLTRLEGAINTFGFETEMRGGSDLGFVVGAAFEIPEYAILASLTYASSQSFQLPSEGVFLEPGTTTPEVINSNTGVYTPAQIRLDVRSPINRKTILMGSIRWAEWSKTHVWPGQQNGASVNSLTDWENTTTYEFGVTRILSPEWALTGLVSHEPDNKNPVTLFSVAGGSTTMGLAATHLGEKATTTLGVNYTKLDDKSGTLAGAPLSFEDNDVWSAGLQVSYKF